MLRFVEVAAGEGGLPSCIHCDGERAAQQASYRDTPTIAADVSAAVASWSAEPGPNVSLSGAEPFAHPELPAVVSACVRAGVKRLRLETAGTALAIPENAAGVLAAGVRHVRVVLLGGTPGVHDALCGRPGSFDTALAGMRLLSEEAARAGVDIAVSVRVPVCRHNVRDLPDIVAVAAEAGARHAVLAVGDGGIDLKGAVPWVTAACDSGTVNSVWVEVTGVPWCLGGAHVLHLAPLLETHGVGEKAASCESCALDAVCPGAPKGAAGDVAAALVEPAESERLAGRIRGAYVAPLGAGEVE